jgi:hypothetical protein
MRQYRPQLEERAMRTEAIDEMTTGADVSREAVLRALGAIDRAAAERMDEGSEATARGRRQQSVLEIASAIHTLHSS